MKKLFTLFAAAALTLSANAQTVIVDGEVDFTTQTELKLYSWGGAVQALGGTETKTDDDGNEVKIEHPKRVSLSEEGLHYHSEEAVDPGWAVQFFPFGNIAVEEGTVYTIEYTIKGTVEQNFSFFVEGFVDNSGGYGAAQISTDWETRSFQFECPKDGNVNLQIQCGDYIGDWWMKSIKVSHIKDDSAVEVILNIKEELVELLENGDASQPWADPSIAFNDQEKNFTVCAWGKENAGDPHPADIEDGAFVVHAGDCVSEGDPSAWDNQFWIQATHEFAQGDQFKVSFKYKASQAAVTNTQAHKQNPSDYLHWQMVGDVSFTTDWQTFEKNVTVDGSQNGMWSVAFNLNPAVKTATDFWFDDLSIATPVITEGYFVATNVNGTPVEITEVDDEEGCNYIVVGTEEAPVQAVWISTKMGSESIFKANAIKLGAELEEYLEDFTEYAIGNGKAITLPEAGIWKISIDEAYVHFEMTSESGINSVNADAKKAVSFNLAGQRVEDAKGLVIKNGKVMFVK